MSFLDLKEYMGQMVYQYVPNIRRHGNKLNFRCPICGDGKKKNSHRGWFYLDTGSYICWNAGCSASESGMSGLQFLSIVSGKSIPEVRQILIKKAGSFSKAVNGTQLQNFDVQDPFKDNTKRNIHRYILDKIDLNEWTDELPFFVKKYIEKRKLDKATYLPSEFKFYYDKKMKRLVIPWNNEYYQERSLLKSQKDQSKYIFPSNTQKPIFGLENIDKNFKYIFLVEGVFDSVWVKNGVAVGSLTLSNHQKNLLKQYEKDFNIVYLLDNQFSDESSMLKTKKLANESPFTNIFVWPKELKSFKDINQSIIYNDKFKDIWKNQNFLTKYICSGLKVKLSLI